MQKADYDGVDFFTRENMDENTPLVIGYIISKACQANAC